MLITLLDEATLATRAGDDTKAEQLLRQMAAASAEAVNVALKALWEPDKLRKALAIRVLHVIGYPQNESAIPELLYHIGDPNLPGWQEAVETLIDMGPDVVVPHIIAALLMKGPPYHTVSGKKDQTWAYDVEGICFMLSMSTIPSEYALRCCPTISFLLVQAEAYPVTATSPDIGFLLDVIEKAGHQVEYVLPTLLALAQKHHESDIGKRAKQLASTFPPSTVADYTLLVIPEH